jgi:hypothetical protein
MRCAGEPLRDRVEEDYRQSNGRQDERHSIDCGGRQNKASGTQHQPNYCRQFRNEQVARSCARIALIERPINQPVEKHRRRAREHHTDDDEEQHSR